MTGTPTHGAALPATSHPVGSGSAKFVALQNRDCRFYLGGAMLAMMGDNVEHVISYWVLFQTFHSPALAGFAVISHWVPFLLFSVYFGSLADRYDCRKVIQASQLLFIGVSVGWGILFATHQLEVWHAMLLLACHGMAAALWGPAEQLLLHDIVGPQVLPSAVRLNVTARNLGILCGPAVGSVLLIVLGPDFAIFANVLLYLPLTIWLMLVPYTGHLRDDPSVRRPRMSVVTAMKVLRDVADNPVLIAMITLGGLGAVFVGAALGPQMPEFAQGLGIQEAGVAYGVLLAANAAGGVLGGIVLEGTQILKPNARSAILTSVGLGLFLFGFAVTENYAIALAFLFCAGVMTLATQSIAQTLVQLLAPPAERGRVLGVYGMASQGLKAGSGFTVGIFGVVVGLRGALGISALLLSFLSLMVLFYLVRVGRGTNELLEETALPDSSR